MRLDGADRVRSEATRRLAEALGELLQDELRQQQADEQRRRELEPEFECAICDS